MAYVPLAKGYTCRCDLCARMQYAAGTDCGYRNHWIGNARKAVGCMPSDESSIEIRYSHGEIMDPAAPEPMWCAPFKPRGYLGCLYTVGHCAVIFDYPHLFLSGAYVSRAAFAACDLQ